MITEEQWKRFQDLLYKPFRDQQKRVEEIIIKAIGDDKPSEKPLLTPDEKRLMQQVAKGTPYKSIENCGEPQTIKNKVSVLGKKFGCRGKKKLVIFLKQHGEI